MGSYASAALRDALQATKAFLLPVDARQWAKLALVAFFVGGGSGFNAPQSFGSPGSGGEGGEVPMEIPGIDGLAGLPDSALLVGLVALVAVVVLLVLGVLVLGPIMEYVLLECLRTREVTLRAYLRARWPAGLRLLGFRIGLLVVALAVFLPIVVLGALVSPAFFLFAVPLAVVVLPLFVLVNGFTTLFVVPITVVEDCGILAGWRHLWPVLREDSKETAAFAVWFALLSIGLGLLVGIVTAITTVVVLIPFALTGFLTYLAGGSALTPPVIVALAILAVVLVVVYLAIVATIKMPVLVYKRYYALVVLGDLSARFDLIPGLRGTIRAEDSDV